MPRYYCDYCDTYLTHDSPSVRKQHNAGYKHKANVRTYYQQFDEQQNQSLIDQKIKEHLGQAAAFQQQVGSSFSQHLMAQRPFLPVRPPILPRPVFSLPGYGPVPGAPQSMAPPGAPPAPMQLNSLPRPPPMTYPAPMGAPNPVMYQTNPAPAVGGGYPPFQSAAPAAPAAVATDSAPPSETSH